MVPAYSSPHQMPAAKPWLFANCCKEVLMKIQPGQPLAQMGSIAINCRKDCRGVPLLQQFQTNAVTNVALEHDLRCSNAPFRSRLGKVLSVSLVLQSRERKGALTLVLFAFVKLLCQIIIQADFFNRMELALQIIYVLFFVLQDLLEQRARCIVADLDGLPDRGIQVMDGRKLQSQVVVQLPLHVFSDLDGP